MSDNPEQQSPFQDIAEKKVMEQMAKNDRLLKELHRLSVEGSQLAATLTKNELFRVVKKLFKKASGEKVELHGQAEKQLDTMVENYIGIYLLLYINHEKLIKASQKELTKARNEAEKHYEKQVSGDGLSANPVSEEVKGEKVNE